MLILTLEGRVEFEFFEKYVVIYVEFVCGTFNVFGWGGWKMLNKLLMSKNGSLKLFLLKIHLVTQISNF